MKPIRPILESILDCPTCHRPLALNADSATPMLTCASCRRSIPVRSGIPRFVESHYAENFALEWHKHKQTQFDHGNMTLSRDDFFRYTAWNQSDLQGILVLDAGCGSGRFSKVALDCGAQVVAVDLSEAVDAANENLAEAPAFAAVQADILALPFRDASFDAIFSIGVLQHTPRPYACVEKLLRLVKPGGRVALWFYGYRSQFQRALGLMHMRYFLRPVLRHVPPRSLYSFVRWYVPKLLPVSRAVRNIRASSRIPFWEMLVPVANRDYIPGTTEGEKIELAVLDTFDWYSPRYDWPLSEKRIARMMRDQGFARIVRTVQGGLTGVRNG